MNLISCSNISALRERRKLSQRGLSVKIGRSKGYVAQIECGHVKNPSVETINNIARVLGVSIDALINYDHNLENSMEEDGIFMIRYNKLNREEKRKVKDFVYKMLDYRGHGSI